MRTFEEQIIESIQKKIILDIQKANMVDFPYNERIKVPSDIVKRAYAEIDHERILKIVKEQIEEQIAKSIVGSLLTETANDTKKMMCDPELRQQIRNKIYPQIMKLTVN